MAAFDAKQMRDAFELMRGLLKEYDLLSLSTKMWNFMTQTGSMDPTAIGLWLEQQNEFKSRFPAIEARRKAKLPPISPQEYVTYEREARQLMQAAGLPPGFYDRYSDFTSLITKDVSIREVGQRIEQGYNFVARATPQVRAAFAKFYGANSDAAIAAYFLSPNVATDVILENARKAQIAGAGAQMGLNLNLTTADRLADMGVDYEEALAGMAQIAELAPLFDETVGESQAHMGGVTTQVEHRRALRPEDLLPQVQYPEMTTNDAMTNSTPGGAGGGGGGEPPPPRPPQGDAGKKAPLLREGLRWDPVTGEVIETHVNYNDQTGEVEGVGLVFGDDPAAKRRAQKRRAERAALLGGGGGATVGQGGSALGTAEGRRRR